MANEYCTVQDLYRHGLPRGALANPGQLVADINTTTGVYTLDGHGFGDSSDRTPVTFAFQADGALQGYVCRFETADGKELRPLRYGVRRGREGRGSLKRTVTVLRSWLRYYAAMGWCDPGLVAADERDDPVRGIVGHSATLSWTR